MRFSRLERARSGERPMRPARPKPRCFATVESPRHCCVSVYPLHADGVLDTAMINGSARPPSMHNLALSLPAQRHRSVCALPLAPS